MTGQTVAVQMSASIAMSSPSVRRQQPVDVADHRVDVGALRMQRLAPGEGQQPPGQIGAAERRVQRFAAQFRRLRRSAVTNRFSRSRLPMMTPSRLLKSCAMPPVRLPIASIFCACPQLTLDTPALGDVLRGSGQSADGTVGVSPAAARRGEEDASGHPDV